ncbi:uncharacterized protein LOC117249922 isoform X1 [Epinephelus lanceolatus]
MACSVNHPRMRSLCLSCAGGRSAKMFPPCVLLMLLCLQYGRLCHALQMVQSLNLQVEYGESAILPCDGSAYLEEEGSVQWEAMGEDVAILWSGELHQGDKFQDRVEPLSEDKLREGDWSVVLRDTMLSDTDMYECIWQGRKTVATVWLTVTVPHVKRSIVVPAGDSVDLACYVQISRSQSVSDMLIWWTRNGSTILSIEKEDLYSTVVVSSPEDVSRISLGFDGKEAFHLYMSPTKISDSGEYHCLYKTRETDEPRSGTPESITLTVLETDPTDIVFNHDETTDDWLSASDRPTIVTTEEVTGVNDLTPVLLEESTQLMKVVTKAPSMEAFEETMTSFPDEEASSKSLPWVRIGLITGVLLVTVAVLCILKAQQKI